MKVLLRFLHWGILKIVQPYKSKDEKPDFICNLGLPFGMGVVSASLFWPHGRIFGSIAVVVTSMIVLIAVRHAILHHGSQPAPEKGPGARYISPSVYAYGEMMWIMPCMFWPVVVGIASAFLKQYSHW